MNMKYLLLLIGLFLTGCATTAHIPGSLPGTEDALKAAGTALWPIALASFLCILAGAGLFAFMKNWKLLAVGVGLGLVPPLFYAFLQPVAPYVAWMILVAAGAAILGGMAYGSYRLYDYIRDEERKND